MDTTISGLYQSTVQYKTINRPARYSCSLSKFNWSFHPDKLAGTISLKYCELVKRQLELNTTQEKYQEKMTQQRFRYIWCTRNLFRSYPKPMFLKDRFLTSLGSVLFHLTLVIILLTTPSVTVTGPIHLHSYILALNMIITMHFV